MDAQQEIKDKCDYIREFLLAKNREYGNSALNPLRIFSTADPIEQLNIRIDDKISRISTRTKKTIKEDTVLDLVGYLILLLIANDNITETTSNS